MGKKGGGWFSAVKKALSPQSKEKKDQKSKSKKNQSVQNKSSDVVVLSESVNTAEETKQNEVEVNNNEQSKHAYSVAVATAAAAEAAVAAAHAAAEVVRLTTVSRYAGKSKEEIATIKIQTAFRGYLARRALRALRGLVRLKSLIESQSVKRQSATTLRCMQTLAHVQSQIRTRRIRMSEDNQALQRQLQQKHEREFERMKMGELWDDRIQSKEQVEANLQNKQEAALRRERALAYAFTHQQTRKNHKNSTQTFMDPNNPHWGWSWLERWMASRPWEAKTMTEKENDNGSVKSFRTVSVAGEINRVYGLRDHTINNNNSKPSPTTAARSSRPQSRHSPSTPGRRLSSGKTKPRTPKNENGWGGQDDDIKSTMSIQSERYRRHSIAGSVVRDDESLSSSPAVPSYMAATKSAKAKTKVSSPMGVVENDDQNQQPMVGSVKKRLSFPGSPGVLRRHSVPGKFETTHFKDVQVD